MFVYEKKLQYPVRIANPNPKLAAFIISQYGGPDGFWIYKFLSTFCMQNMHSVPYRKQELQDSWHKMP